MNKRQSGSLRTRRPFSFHADIWHAVATMPFLICSLFVAASLYTPWTGAFGACVSSWIFARLGGAVIIPLCFVIYVCLLRLFSLPVPNFIRQTAGTILLFVLAGILLGLGVITGTMAANRYEWLSAGVFGYTLAMWTFSKIGAIGILVGGLVMVYVSLALYGIPVFSHIKLPVCNFRRGSAKNAKHENVIPPTEDNMSPYAPNIAEYDSESDYFNVEEATPFQSKPSRNRTVATSESDNSEDDFPIQNTSINPGNIANGDKVGVFPPPIDIFGPEEAHEGEMNEAEAQPLGEKIIKALEEFRIEASLAEMLVGPTVIQFRIQLAPGTKVSRVASMANDIALATAVPSLRIEAPIPGKSYVGIEIPNPKRRGVPLRTLIESDEFQNSESALPLPFGVAVNCEYIVAGLEDMPHILIAGATGSGKSVFINACIAGLCSKRKPEELRMILVDTKRVEAAIYDKLPHLLTSPVTDTNKAIHVLAWAVREMEDRYTSFAKARVRSLERFNEKVLPKDRLPHIVIVVDELADLMLTAPKDVEGHICRLAQMARATGIHLMLATQRPSANVITDIIKANIPARVAFTLPGNADSRTIIDSAGAEKLLGSGDMLFLSTKYPKPVRIQSPWVDEAVLTEWLDYMDNLFGTPKFIDIDGQCGERGDDKGINCDDDMLEQAIETVLSTGSASASALQRRLRIGFSRASRLIDMMEQIGIVGPADGAKPRKILTNEDGARELLKKARGGKDD